MERSYPFIPKSTSFLEQGQFWAIPLGDGSFSCGVVISRVTNNGKIDSRLFLAGLLNWHSKVPPKTTDLTHCGVIESAYTHIKAITETGGHVLGVAAPQIRAPIAQEHTDSISTWGYNFIVKKAERAFTAS